MPIEHIKSSLKKRVRSILNFAPKIGLAPKATKFRKDGISALIRVRNEEYWIRPCVLSIKDYVEEILVIDNGSTDGTMEVIEKLKSEISTPIIILSFPCADYCEVSNIVLMESSYRWILKWDADFIAQTTSSGNFANLRRFILNLDQDRYHMIFMNLVNLAGDLWHQPKEKGIFTGEKGALHYEAYLWNYSPKMQYVWKDYEGYSKVESLIFPPYVRFLDWPEFSVFHVGGIRSIERMLLDYFCDFVEKVFPKGRPPLSKIEEACWKMAEKNFQTNDHKKIVESFFKLFREELTPYKQNLYGPHPPALLPYLQNPRFQIIYDKNGQIIGRIPDCVWEI